MFTPLFFFWLGRQLIERRLDHILLAFGTMKKVPIFLFRKLHLAKHQLLKLFNIQMVCQSVFPVNPSYAFCRSLTDKCINGR